MQPREALTLFEEIGGEETIRNLVKAFYPKVYRDPDLSPLFPDGVEGIMQTIPVPYSIHRRSAALFRSIWATSNATTPFGI